MTIWTWLLHFVRILQVVQLNHSPTNFVYKVALNRIQPVNNRGHMSRAPPLPWSNHKGPTVWARTIKLATNLNRKICQRDEALCQLFIESSLKQYGCFVMYFVFVPMQWLSLVWHENLQDHCSISDQCMLKRQTVASNLSAVYSFPVLNERTSNAVKIPIMSL